MTIQEFISDISATVKKELGDGAIYAELVYTGIVMDHMVEIGMTNDPVECHYEGKIRNANVRISGYSISDEQDQLDLFVTIYAGVEEPTLISDADTKKSVEQCFRFLTLSAQGEMSEKLDPTSEVRSLASTIREIYNDLQQIRIFVITDQIANSKSFKTREINGKSIRLEVMDIERLFRHVAEGRSREEVAVNFEELFGTSLPCVFVAGQGLQYDYALTAIPGEVLRLLYEKFGSRLLEANVRSFLSAKSKGVNAGIQNTLRKSPEKFMAYNNGLVIVADQIRIDESSDGLTGITWLQGLQIVNGGQTTASLYFSKKKFPDTNLETVRVAAKIIILKEKDPNEEESLISDISRFANSQNAVKQSDLSANKPFHVAIEKIARSVFCPDGVGQWFYERAAGSYNTLLAREGNTPAKLKKLKESIPPSRKISKTELARYINAWNQHPDHVSLGLQKNFDKFMASIGSIGIDESPAPNAKEFKEMIAKAKIYKDLHKIVLREFPAFQANITAYTISIAAKLIGDDIDFEKIWQQQSGSPELMNQLKRWAHEVKEALHSSANGRMVSEWAKKSECKETVFSNTFSAVEENIPEIRKF